MVSFFSSVNKLFKTESIFLYQKTSTSCTHKLGLYFALPNRVYQDLIQFNGSLITFFADFQVVVCRICQVAFPFSLDLRNKRLSKETAILLGPKLLILFGIFIENKLFQTKVKICWWLKTNLIYISLFHNGMLKLEDKYNSK